MSDDRSATTTEQPDSRQPFWNKPEWRAVIPDTVLAHHQFRVDGKSSCERKAHVQGVALILVSASVPVAAAGQLPRWFIAALGALATVLAGIGQLYGWKENVVLENRSLMEIQQQLVSWKNGERPYRVMKTSPDSIDRWKDDNSLLAIRVERIVQSEGQAWAAWFDMDHEQRRGSAGTESSS